MAIEIRTTPEQPAPNLDELFQAQETFFQESMRATGGVPYRDIHFPSGLNLYAQGENLNANANGIFFVKTGSPDLDWGVPAVCSISLESEVEKCRIRYCFSEQEGQKRLSYINGHGLEHFDATDLHRIEAGKAIAKLHSLLD